MSKYLEAFGLNANLRETRFVIEKPTHDSSGTLLYEISEDGLFDNWFRTVQEAKDSGLAEFGIEHDGWVETDIPPYKLSHTEEEKLKKIYDMMRKRLDEKASKEME